MAPLLRISVAVFILFVAAAPVNGQYASSTGPDIEAQDDEEDATEGEKWRRRSRYLATHVGDYDYDWPYHETALYRHIPAIRYNRVEGLVLGVGLPPLSWYDFERAKLFGQLSYAFAMGGWRYEAGVEVQPAPDVHDDFGVRFGAAYRRNTVTNDVWKSGWVENSLASFFFKNDFFDYYQVEGWTVYSVQQITRFVQTSIAFRSENHSSLEQNTSWALFGGDGFRMNPFADEGSARSIVAAVEGGSVRGLDYGPRGLVFRAEAEFGSGLGGDFDFTRYLGDVRAYVPFAPLTTLSVRARGGWMDGDELPFQKYFTLGGIGSIRGYPQNAFYGTAMLLGNAELAVDEVSLLGDWFLDDLQVFGLFDAGWIGDDRFDGFSFDDVLPAAGVGVGLDDRHVRLELAWPLRDAGYGRSPSLWLRLNPSF